MNTWGAELKTMKLNRLQVALIDLTVTILHKKNPVGRAVWASVDGIVGIASIVIGINEIKLAVDYLPLVLYTSYAETVNKYNLLKDNNQVFDSEPRFA